MKNIKLIVSTVAIFVSSSAFAAMPSFSANSLKDVLGFVENVQAVKDTVESVKGKNQSTPNSQDYSHLNKYNVKTPNQCPEHYTLGMPVVQSADKEKIERRSFYLCHSGYAVQFDPATKNPIWVSENLTRDRVKAPKENRTDDFQPNPFVPQSAQATLTDYRGSKFDRGHMAPAADMYGVSPTAMSESFFLTNMIPQVGPNQNRGIWSELESKVRDWAEARGQLLVVTGPVYDQGGISTIGKSKVWVPTRLYKVIIDPKTYESVAFLIPNFQIVTKKTRSLDEGNPLYPQTLAKNAIQCNQQPCNLSHFQVPISTVEDMTGLRFFSSIQDGNYTQVRSSIKGNWK